MLLGKLFILCLLQVASVHEELQQRESRWSSTLGRYRRKIELLENQNRELQSDLKVMEQERLKWWQKQVTVGCTLIHNSVVI